MKPALVGEGWGESKRGAEAIAICRRSLSRPDAPSVTPHFVRRATSPAKRADGGGVRRSPPPTFTGWQPPCAMLAATMTTTTTSQFGRRGAGPAPSARRPEATGASTALQTATGWNRSAPTQALPPDMAEAIARVNRTIAKGPEPVVVDRGQTAPAVDLMALLFSTKGRVCRRDYWTFNIAASMTAVVAILTAFVSLPALQALIVAAPVAMVSVRIRSCLRIKRWHDRDKPAVWTLVGLIPFVGWIWTFVECGLLEGTPGPNRYGPSPK
jgi:uncharacterized membrane protein YhaH (DUF805 family)